MTTYLIIPRIVIFTSFALIFGLPSVALAADQPSAGVSPSVATDGQIVPASGAVEDTLKACLARIPKGASAGQNMLAELGCQRDEQIRTSLQTAPKF